MTLSVLSAEAAPTTPDQAVVTEAVGVFDGYDELYETIKDLGTHGFGRHQISVRGSEAAVKESFGEESIAPDQLEDNPYAPRSPIIGVDELGVAQGVLVGASLYLGACIAIVGTNGLSDPDSIMVLAFGTILAGLIGVALAEFLGTQYRRFFQKQVAAGGLVLWVETPDEQSSQTAEAILHKHGAHDVHTHQIAMAA